MKSTAWLLAGNLIFAAGGILAYFGNVGLPVVAAFAMVAAIPALWDIKHTNTWFDRAASAAAGTWAVVAIIIILPYITVEEGRSLWSYKSYAGIGIAASSIGLLLWNACGLIGAGHPMSRVRSYAALHVLTLAGALYLLPQDAVLTELMVRDEVLSAYELTIVPALAAIPAVMWALAWATTDVAEPA